MTLTVTDVTLVTPRQLTFIKFNFIKFMNTLAQFKAAYGVHLHLCDKSLNLLSYSYLHKGKLGAILTRIRLGLSPLRNQLFCYNLIDNPFCPSYGNEVETVHHFFLHCASHAGKITILKQQKFSYAKVFFSSTRINIDLTHNLSTCMLNILLNGINIGI